LDLALYTAYTARSYLIDVHALTS